MTVSPVVVGAVVAVDTGADVATGAVVVAGVAGAVVVVGVSVVVVVPSAEMV